MKAVADATSTGQAIGGFVPLPTQGRPAFPAQYEILWARLDYLLGKRPDWPMCKAFPGAREARGEYIGFCGAYSQDVKQPPPPVRAAAP